MSYNQIAAAWKLQSVSPAAWDSLPIEEKIVFAFMYGQSITSYFVEEKLLAYSREIYQKTDCDKITLDQLIDYHRELRLANNKHFEEMRQVRLEAKEQGVKEAKEEALANNWFSHERLKGMTLGELVNLLADIVAD